MLRAAGPALGRWRIWAVFAALLVLVPASFSEERQAKEIKLEQEFTRDAREELPEIFIHIGEIRARVKKLLKKEYRLTEIEASVAADLSGALEKLSKADEGSREQSWALHRLAYEAVAKAAGLAGEAAGFVDEAPAIMNLYWFGTRVAREIDRVSSERQQLEAKYFDILTGKLAKTKAHKLLDEASVDSFPKRGGERKRIVLSLRKRVRAVRLKRQNTMEALLLATRYADTTGWPTAEFERTVAWATEDVAETNRLKKLLAKAKTEEEDIRRKIDSKVVLTKYAERHRDRIKKKADYPGKKSELAAAEAKVAALSAEQKALGASLTKKKAEIAKLQEKIGKEKVGVDSREKKKGRTKSESLTRRKIAELAATMSPRYAELSIRRRIHERATREAAHNYDIAKKLNLLRRLMNTALQREALEGGGNAAAPEVIRAVYIDQGIVAIAEREKAAEDGFVAQVDYFHAVLSAWKEFGGKKLRGDKAATFARYGVDTIQMGLHLASLQSTLFFERWKKIYNACAEGYDHISTELDKLHVKVIKSRKATDKQMDFLVDTLRIGDGALRGHLKLPSKPNLTPYKWTPAKADVMQDVHDLFREDKAFFNAVNGGLLRIASSLDTTRKARLISEYAIAYERACYTIRDTHRMENTMRGLEGKTGNFWRVKFFLSPIKMLKALGVAIADVFTTIEIDAHADWRKKQTDMMVELFEPLARIDFDYSRTDELKGDKAKVHAKHKHLWIWHPDYRKFWYTVEKEDALQSQTKLQQAYRASQSSLLKKMIQEKMDNVSASTMSPKVLARAYVEDARDQMQIFDYPGVVKSLTLANDMDPRMVSWNQVRAIEAKLAWWDTQYQAAAVGTQIGDAIIWALITKRFNAAVMNDLAARGWVKLPAAQSVTLWKEITDCVKGQFLPLRSIISRDDIAEMGLRKAVLMGAWKTLNEINQDHFRDDLLVNWGGMDPDVASRVASIFYGLTQEIVEGAARQGKHKVDEYKRMFEGDSLYLHSRYLVEEHDARQALTEEQRNEIEGPAVRALKTPKSVAEVVDDAKGSYINGWLARRRVMQLTRAMRLRAALERNLTELDAPAKRKKTDVEEVDPTRTQPGEDGTRKPRPGDPDYKPVKKGKARRKTLKELVEERRKMRTLDDPAELERTLTKLGVNEDDAMAFVEGRLKGEKRNEIADAAFSLLERFSGPRRTELDAMLNDKAMWKGKEQQRQRILDALDNARLVVLFESFGFPTRSTMNGDTDSLNLLNKIATQLGEKDGMWKADDSPFKNMTPDKLKLLMSAVEFIVPTGSAGGIGAKGGEYNRWTSDLDMTAVLNEKILAKVLGPDNTPQARQALEYLFKAAVHMRSSGKLNTDKFDFAYMADPSRVTLGEGPELRRPSDFLKLISEEGEQHKGKTPEEIAASIRKTALVLAEAQSGVERDAKHGDRYTARGRIKMLVWLNALGLNVIVRDGDGYAQKKKSALMEQADALSARLKQYLFNDENARLGPADAADIASDDLKFMGKKLPDLVAMMGKPNLDDVPLQAYMKELDKRGIRILVSLVLGAEGGPEILNGFISKARKGERIDHSNICEAALTVLSQRAKATGKNYDNLKKIVESVRDMKAGKADALELVKRHIDWPEGKPLPLDSPEFKKGFLSLVKGTMSLVHLTGEQAMVQRGEHMDEIYQARTKLEEEIRSPNFKDLDEHTQNIKKNQLEAIRHYVGHNMTASAPCYRKLGEHMKGAKHDLSTNRLREAYLKGWKDAGATRQDVEAAFKAAGYKAEEVAQILKTYDEVGTKPEPRAVLVEFVPYAAAWAASRIAA